MPQKLRQSLKKESQEKSNIEIQNKGNFDSVISTGSTLLDLTISGSKVRGGGIPGGIIVEIYGPSSAGKTSVLSEICASALKRQGHVRLLDPEARIDEEYSRIFGVELDKTDYHRPDTVTEMFDSIYKWSPPDAPTGSCNVVATDSLAALSSKLEMSDKGDKMAGRRIAKDFNEGLRKTCRLIKKNNWLIVNTNQIRMGDAGEITPGGKGLPFYASLRIRVGPPQQNKYIEKIVKFKGKDHERIIGIKSTCTVKKSSIDIPYRHCDVYIIFNYGIDDIRANLQYIKSITKETTYDVFDKQCKNMVNAIDHIEKNNLVSDLKEKTIDYWEELNDKFMVKREPKVRE